MTARYNEDELGRIAIEADVDTTGKTYDQRTDALVKHLRREPDILPVACDWADAGYEPIPDPGNNHRQPQLVKHDGVYYVFHEYYTGDHSGTSRLNCWGIGVEWATSLAGPWTFVESILPISDVATDPDYYYIADPSVLHIPWAEHKFHMWFDMTQTSSTGFATSTIGHAYADDPLGPWTRQQTGGVTDIVVGTSSAFGGFANFAIHAPEAFLVGNRVHLLCNVYGAGHTTFDVILYIANDMQGIGRSFEAWGPVTTDDTLASGRAYRLQSPLQYNGVLYAILEDRNVNVFAFAWVSSSDNGKSWQEIGSSARAFHSFLIEGRKIIGVTHSHGFSGNDDMRFYALDLDNLSGTQLDADNIGTRTNLPISLNDLSAMTIDLAASIDNPYAIEANGAPVGIGTDGAAAQGGLDIRPITAHLIEDNFDRANGAIGVPWSGATWAVLGNKAVNTPSLGADLALNGGFDSATTSWTLVVGAIASVAGGQSGNCLRVTNTSASFGRAFQSVAAVVGTYYRVGFWHKDGTAGGEIRVGSTAGALDLLQRIGYADSDWTYHTVVVRATTTTLSVVLVVGDSISGHTTLFDGVTIQALTLAELYATQDMVQTVVNIEAGVATGDCGAGVVMRLDSAAAPANCVRAYVSVYAVDYRKIVLDKIVGGAITNLINATATYVAGATLRVGIAGNIYTLFYNGVQISTPQTISDAGITSNTLYGMYATDASVTLDGFSADWVLPAMHIEPHALPLVPVPGAIGSDGDHIYWTNSGGTDQVLDGASGGLSKAIGSEVDTGTDDAKYVTAKALADAHNVVDVAPGTAGNIPKSNGTDWTSEAPGYAAALGADDNYVTDAQLAVIANTSGTNSGNETVTTIKSALGITTLSGANTGDEDVTSIKSKLSITTLSGSNTGDQTNVTGSSGSCTGLAATATALATPRAINGVNFDGSAPITLTKRVITTTDDSTAVIDVDVTDIYQLSAVANTTTFSTTGTPTDGQRLMIRFKDAGVAKGLTWDAVFAACGATPPSTTVAGKWHRVGVEWNAAATKWQIIAVGVEA